jgi:hypothetical protein
MATVQGWVHFTWHSWMSASVLSFAVAALLTLPLSLAERRQAVSADAPGGTLSA